MIGSRQFVLLAIVCVCPLAACGAATSPQPETARTTRPQRQHPAAAPQPSLNVEGTSSTPGVFQVPQMGFVSFRCGPDFSVQPFFDTRDAQSEEAVTIRAQNITRRNFTTRVVGHNRSLPLRQTTFSSEPVVALPFGHYRKVTVAVRTGTEARELTATVTALFVAGTFKQKGYPLLGGCYVKKWLVSMTVSPY